MDTRYYNNIFQVMGTGASVDLGGSSGNVFDYNVFYGANITNEPTDPHKIKLNPRLVSPDSTGFGADTISGYRLKKDSPVINAGMTVPAAPLSDISGVPVPMYEKTDQGAFEYNGPLGIEPLPSNSSVEIFPNPASDAVTIRCANLPLLPVTARLHTMNGTAVLEKIYKPPTSGNLFSLPLNLPDVRSGVYILKLWFGAEYSYETLLLIEK